ncbi:endonuclease/exonuclease/phosphatase family protein [Lutibacter maritimus]|uniref:Metal-dependent hydrolase, endonuclease/exonuclease/phosphatase family n=1 Tax=Lutibacter maritimus TaxID=593133 RepID=A0A1I6Q983_9FLAO|nr:endonuclease/exonuclease/phosphatase family protein [Lutibacter maritimus]SFS48915.1 Metal-dependent hydrolase, endonuclease/exonuclease/phosphatase family [Lutibacter maritimus]
MKNLALLSVTYLLFIQISFGQNLNVMTYNIRLDTQNDGDNRWDVRKNALLKQVLNNKVDILGIQEGLPNQVAYCDSVLVNYNFVGVGRDDGINKGEFSAIFYNKNKYQLHVQNTFWLSETPEVPSKGWDAAYPRICTYLQLSDKKSNKKFWVFNTHFDHVGVKAREEAALLILQKIRKLNTEKLPVILMGDFNLTEDSEVINYINSFLKDSKILSKNKVKDTLGTFNGFNIVKESVDRIDFIFVSENSIKVNKYKVLREKYHGKYPSDHFPVLVNFTLE